MGRVEVCIASVPHFSLGMSRCALSVELNRWWPKYQNQICEGEGRFTPLASFK